MGLLSRPFIAVTSALDRRKPWHRRSRIVGLFVLDGARARLRRDNLHDVGLPPGDEPTKPEDLDTRTITGVWNDLERPRAGSTCTRFGRNTRPEYWYPETEPELLDPDPRVVSCELLTRKTFIPATSLNVLAAAWIQFEVHDWLSHEQDLKAQPFELPADPKCAWPESSVKIFPVRRDPSVEAGSPPHSLTYDSHWWDGSQIYGRNADFASSVRAREHGKFRIDEKTKLPPADLVKEEDLRGVAGNFWLGLGLLHVLFMLEHNAICERLHRAYPSWSDEQLYGKARLVNAALMAKIHTVEWTPAIIAHSTTTWGMRASWYGLLGEWVTNKIGRVGRGSLLSGIPGSRTDDHGVPYSLTEEFVAVYRMHPLLPDSFEFKSAKSGQVRVRYPFAKLQALETLQRIVEIGMPDALYSFGVANPGALVLHNYPAALQNLRRPSGELVDLAATDILRIRESGVPRYNEFRRVFHLKPAASFEELTGEQTEAARLREIYGDIERVDLMIGLLAEPPPKGFGFSDTAFRVFLLMASRRLQSDRFFTSDFTPDVYTREGLEWIRKRSMVTILREHYPELEPVLRGVKNAFAPWDKQQA